MSVWYFGKKIKQKENSYLLYRFVCLSLMMGYLSSRDFTQSFMNWLAQGINIISQGAFLIGVFLYIVLV